MTKDATRETVERVNMRMAECLESARHALRGEGDFDVQSVRRLRDVIGEMAAIVEQPGQLRQVQPEIGGQLDLYKGHLRDLQTLLVQIRLMLHTRQAGLHASQIHITAVSRWLTAFRQTR